jgi:integrase
VVIRCRVDTFERIDQPDWKPRTRAEVAAASLVRLYRRLTCSTYYRNDVHTLVGTAERSARDRTCCCGCLDWPRRRERGGFPLPKPCSRFSASVDATARILDSWVREIGLEPAAYGTYSMRRTKSSLIYRRTRNLRAVQLLLGHSELESTVRYLGIEVDDALEMSEQTEV